MKNWKQSTEEIEALLALGEDEDLYIVSGEGENGTEELYEGKRTVQAIKARLAKERCGGDRWARLDTADGRALAGMY